MEWILVNIDRILSTLLQSECTSFVYLALHHYCMLSWIGNIPLCLASYMFFIFFRIYEDNHDVKKSRMFFRYIILLR